MDTFTVMYRSNILSLKGHFSFMDSLNRHRGDPGTERVSYYPTGT